MAMMGAVGGKPISCDEGAMDKAKGNWACGCHYNDYGQVRYSDDAEGTVVLLISPAV